MGGSDFGSQADNLDTVTDIRQLAALYPEPGVTSVVKETREVIPEYRQFIEASSFCMVATAGKEGMDCSPRGDLPGFVRVLNERTLAMPDRRGNNRIDTIRNIVETGTIALCFLVPGSRNCLRVNGKAAVTLDRNLCQSFAVGDQAPRSVVIIRTEAVYFQCGRAIMRSGLWEPENQVDPATLPTPGSILQRLSGAKLDGGHYDHEWEGRANKTLW